MDGVQFEPERVNGAATVGASPRERGVAERRISPPPRARPSAETAPPPAYDVRRLMQSGTQAQMVLDGVAYSLRITRAGKLILTK